MTTDSDQPQTPYATASAPGKVILFGEHAVVYGRPAIAVPVTDVQAAASVSVAEPGSGVHILAADLPAPDGRPGGYRYRLQEAPGEDALRTAVELALRHTWAGNPPGPEPDLLVTVRSTIPIARGLGSGAAVATAVVRAIGRYYGRALAPDEVSRLVYEVEKLHHGTPSGIDNTVVAYEQPVYFVRGMPVARLSVGAPINLVIADTGIVSSTRAVVGDLRRRRDERTEYYEGLFDEVGAIARQARMAVELGDLPAIGRLMNENHHLLVALGVSTPRLDSLVEAARSAGALGAKMSGAGWGGNMLALVDPAAAPGVAEALRAAGAVRTIFSHIA
jgi:mevalonate kinase